MHAFAYIRHVKIQCTFFNIMHVLKYHVHFKIWCTGKNKDAMHISKYQHILKYHTHIRTTYIYAEIQYTHINKKIYKYWNTIHTLKYNTNWKEKKRKEQILKNNPHIKLPFARKNIVMHTFTHHAPEELTPCHARDMRFQRPFFPFKRFPRRS